MAVQLTTSRLLVRLDTEIRNEKASVEADAKRAERAAYLARLGRMDEARAEVHALRKKYALQPNVLVSAWLHLVDGLISHFHDMSKDARGKVLRSHALSSSARILGLQALASAWMAHLDYLRLDGASMVKYVLESIRLTTLGEHRVRSRISLVVAQSYHFAGRYDLAAPWYAAVRIHASADGDDATLSALMHNMSWLHAQCLRANDCELSVERTDRAGHALLSAESAGNYDALIGASSLSALVPILRAQILTVRKDYKAALDLFETEFLLALQQGMGRLRSDLLADQAWCRLNLGQSAKALEDALDAEAGIDESGHADDRAVAHARLAQVFSSSGIFAAAERHRRLGSEAWLRHMELQSSFIQYLAVLPDAPVF